MKTKYTLACLLGVLVASSSAWAAAGPLAKLRAVPFTDVTISDSFWAPRRETTALRLVVNLQKDWSAGAHEWKVVEVDDDQP